MFRFRLGSIPVEVHPSHLLVSAVLALQTLPRSSGGGDSAMGPMVAHVLSWVTIVFVSVLVHELGHALASRAFGYQPSIALVWLGGHTQPNAPGPIPWHRDVLLTFAGPLFGLMLAGVAWGVRHTVTRASPDAFAFFNLLMYANLFWTVLNLLPVLPLDGGRISTAISMRLFGPRGFVVAQGLAFLVSAVIVWLSIQVGALFIGVLFGFYGFQALRVVVDTFRAAPSGEVSGPQAETLAQAQAAAPDPLLDPGRVYTEVEIA